MKQFNQVKHFLLLMLLTFGASRPASAITCGTYTVGVGGDFATLAQAVSDLNASSITCPIVLNILPGTYTGADWVVKLSKINGTSSTNTITIQAKDGAGTVIINNDGAAAANYIIKLDSTNYVTIKNLELNNTHATYGRVIDISGTSSNNVVSGCTLTGVTGATSSDARSIVTLGTSAASLAGSGNRITGNVIKNGYSAIQVIGSASATTDNNEILNNTITDPIVNGIYTNYAGNVIIAGNGITGTATTLAYAMYLSYSQNGGTIANNTATINTTTGNHYGLYNNYIGTPTSAIMNITNNNFKVTVTSGTAYSLYNYYSNRLNITGNTFEAIGSTGTVYQVFMAHYGVDVTATGNTFTATCGTGGGINNTTSYYFIYNPSTSAPNNVTVRENTFNFNSAGGGIGTSSSGNYHMYYPIDCKINKNRYNVNITSSSVTMYGFGGYYWLYYATNTTFDSNKITLNAPNGVSTLYNLCYPYGVAYGTNNSFSNDTVVGTIPSGSIYLLGYYTAIGGTGIRLNNNYIALNSTSATVYDAYYFTQSLTKSQANNNKFILNTTSGTAYWPYFLNYNNTGTQTNDNEYTVSGTTTSVNMPYYMMYAGSGSAAKNNKFTYKPTGSGSCSNCPYYLLYQGSSDTVENNVWDWNSNGGSYNTSNYYQGSLTRNNTWNLNTTSGSINFYFYYPSNGLFENNKINATTTTGTIYGYYEYPYPGTGYGLNTYGNIWNLRSTSGTIYGYNNAGSNGGGKNTMVNNIFSAQSNTGAIYLYRNLYGNYEEAKIFNNIFHGNTTSATCQLLNHAGGSATYPGKTYLYNNIFSRSNAGTGNAVDIADTAYFVGDYNLYYSPGTATLRAGNPSISTTSMILWKAGTGVDQNSLFYDPAHRDVANLDFRPDPANPNAWSRQGRGTHLASDTTDIMGNPRARNRFEGVPDIGAYEFDLTSTPPAATAMPANPVANSVQAFLLGGDTVATIEWGNSVPPSVAVRQYTGYKANVTPAATERMFFYTAINTPDGVYEYSPAIKYKEPWLGNISNETNARIAKSSNGGAWIGYNYHNGTTDSIKNRLMANQPFDSLSSMFTGVQNSRIGIRCLVPPAGLNHSEVTAFTAKESWESVFYPVGYQIIVEPTLAPNLSKIQFVSPVTSGNPIYPASNLTENTTYYVNVRTICNPKDTSDWAVDSFRTMITCHAPDIKSTSITDKSAVVYWDTIQTAVGYEYVLDQSPNNPAFGTGTKHSSQYEPSLQPGTTYYAHARAKCSSIYEMSDWSTHSFTTKWPAGINELKGNAGITAYPNPVKNMVLINVFNVPADGSGLITITDIAGKMVYSAQVTDSKFEINMREFATGMYLLKYTDNSRTETIKLNKD